MSRPLIVVSNDDGITSKGIKVLIEEMSKIGEVFVVAPDSPNSGMGHAITVDATLHIKKSPIFGSEIQSYECSGTPADCVKLAKHELLKDRKIDLFVSGINHGHNASISVIYSGTMSAAIEGAIEGIPAIGFSLDDFGYDAEFDHTRPYIQKITKEVLAKGLPPHVALNVNFPPKSDTPIKGIKVTNQCNGYWKEEFDARRDPHGRPYYWMGGQFIDREPNNTENDYNYLKDNYISVVPCKYDMTDYEVLKVMSEWEF